MAEVSKLCREHFFESRAEMEIALGQAVVDHLTATLAEQAALTVMLSGGSSPEPLYRHLSTLPLPWQRIAVGLVDERWVDSDHASSNEAFINRCLLQGKAVQARLVGMKNGADSPAAGQAECEQVYRGLPQPWALTILGMGNDGHTASLFPHAKGLSQALDLGGDQLCGAIEATPSPVTGALTERMSLTLPGLLQSQQLILVISGEEKRTIYELAKAGTDPLAMPVRALWQQTKVPVAIYWAP